jgi:hypothetical protein
MMRSEQEYHRRKAEKKRETDKRTAKRGIGRRSFRHPDPIARFTFWVSAFTLFLAFFAAIQTVSFIESERAFVYVEFNSFNSGQLIAGTQTIVNMTNRNTGKSTGFIDAINITWKFGELPSTPQYIDDPSNIISGPIVAGGGYPARVKLKIGNDPLNCTLF